MESYRGVNPHLTSYLQHTPRRWELFHTLHMVKPVTRIELLSPANKPGGSQYSRYRQKRLETLKAGINLVEIDCLHQTRPILLDLLSSSNRESGAFAYLIRVSDPYLPFEVVLIQVFGGVLDRQPLSDGEQITFDLNPIYSRTASATRIYRQTIDYTQEPPSFPTYYPDDQARIRLRISPPLA